jgi:hypothetical protein
MDGGEGVYACSNPRCDAAGTLCPACHTVSESEVCTQCNVSQASAGPPSLSIFSAEDGWFHEDNSTAPVEFTSQSQVQETLAWLKELYPDRQYGVRPSPCAADALARDKQGTEASLICGRPRGHQGQHQDLVYRLMWHG